MNVDGTIETSTETDYVPQNTPLPILYTINERDYINYTTLLSAFSILHAANGLVFLNSREFE